VTGDVCVGESVVVGETGAVVVLPTSGGGGGR